MNWRKLQLVFDGFEPWREEARSLVAAEGLGVDLLHIGKTAKLPFAGVIVGRVAGGASALGPVTTRGFVPQPNGKQKHENPGPAIFGLLRRAVGSRLSGRWKNTPFFDRETGKPVVTPTVISKTERATLYQ